MMQPLMNRVRAEATLQALNLSALVLTDPLNIYHATGVWPVTGEMGHAGSTIAIVPADQTIAPALVAPQFLHYFQDFSGAGSDGDVAHFLYTGPDQADPTVAAGPSFYRDNASLPPDPAERSSRASTEAMMQRHGAFLSAAAALKAAFSQLGVRRGLVGVDDRVGDQVLKAAGLDVGAVAADPALRRIRIIKSAQEIVLMRHAASSNCAAFRSALQSVKVGDHYDDLRRAFFAETGRRGGRPAFLQIDSTAHEHRDGVIREGRSFMIDAVGTYDRYHGDYGRTVFVGEPDPALLACLEAAKIATSAVRAALKPGLRYSDVTRIGLEAVSRSGHDVRLVCSPHSVGLFHTDEPFLNDQLAFSKADHVIEENMVLSIDCPVLDTDIGGTVHLEDLWLVTADGCEPLNDVSNPFLTLEATPG